MPNTIVHSDNGAAYFSPSYKKPYHVNADGSVMARIWSDHSGEPERYAVNLVPSSIDAPVGVAFEMSPEFEWDVDQFHQALENPDYRTIEFFGANKTAMFRLMTVDVGANAMIEVYSKPETGSPFMEPPRPIEPILEFVRKVSFAVRRGEEPSGPLFDCVSWDVPIRNVAYVGGCYVVKNADGSVDMSTDGIHYEEVAMTDGESIAKVAEPILYTHAAYDLSAYRDEADSADTEEATPSTLTAAFERLEKACENAGRILREKFESQDDDTDAAIATGPGTLSFLADRVQHFNRLLDTSCTGVHIGYADGIEIGTLVEDDDPFAISPVDNVGNVASSHYHLVGRIHGVKLFEIDPERDTDGDVEFLTKAVWSAWSGGVNHGAKRARDAIREALEGR